MKKLALLTLALSTTLTTSIQAKEANSASASTAPCPLAFAGFSFGGTVGYGIGNATVNNTTSSVVTGNTLKNNGQYPYTATSKVGFSGVDGGLIAGYLQRFNNWGAGADFLANWTSAGATDNTSNSNPWFPNVETGTDAIHIKLKNSLQVRGVFSYVISELVMPKIILGWDNSDYNLAYQTSSNVNAPAEPFFYNSSTSTTGSKRLNGLLWGAGVDFLVAESIIFGLEYTGVQSQKVTFTSSANSSISAGSGGGNTVSTSSVSLRPQYNTFKATLKYIPAFTAPMGKAAPTLYSRQNAFQGFTLGGTLGYGIGKASVSHTTSSVITGNNPIDGGDGQYPYTANSKVGFSGVDGGLIAGYLQRFNNWGAGVDFLANWTSAGATGNTSHSIPYDGAVSKNSSVGANSYKIDLKNSLQVRGVLSYVISQFVMPKIMLGWDNSAYRLTYQTTYNIDDGPFSYNSSTSTTGSKRLNGLLWGAGIDFLVAQNVIFGLEYTGVQSQKVIFTSSANNPISATVGGGTNTNTSSVSLQPQYNTFKGTLKYIF